MDVIQCGTMRNVDVLQCTMWQWMCSDPLLTETESFANWWSVILVDVSWPCSLQVPQGIFHLRYSLFYVIESLVENREILFDLREILFDL